MNENRRSPRIGSERTSLIARLDNWGRRWVEALIFELRRTRRVIVTPESRRDGEPPIFVLGVHRSGTTLLRLILDTHSNIACPPESFFIDPIGRVLSDPKAMEGLRAMGFDDAAVKRRLRETISYFFEMYAASHGKARWADKTPSYVNSLELIEELFGPECRYVVMFRHGLDVACSLSRMQIRELEHLQDVPYAERLEPTARYWATCCEKLLAFEEQHRERCIQVRYEQLCAEPERELRRVFEFLDEPFENQVLEFHQHPHDQWIGLQDGKAARSSGFEVNSGIWRNEDPDLVSGMRRAAGEMLQRLGYLDDPES